MITLDQIVERLNQYCTVDQKWVDRIMNYCYPCNQAIADHPSIQVWTDDDAWSAGALGVVNGLIGFENRITSEFCDDGPIERFSLVDLDTLVKWHPEITPDRWRLHGEPITIDSVVATLNEMFALDPQWTQNIATRLIPCSQQLGDYTDVMVCCEFGEYGEDVPILRAGLLGLINGLISPDGKIRRSFDASGQFCGFQICTPEEVASIVGSIPGARVEFVPGDDFTSLDNEVG